MKPTRLWDINEAILLLDTLLAIREKGISRKEAVRSISSELQLRAIKQGMELDNTYHKPKDIDQQMYGLEYVLTNGKTGLKKYAGSATFKKVVSMYQTNRESFEEAVKVLRDPINNLQTEPRTEKKEQSRTQPAATETSADSKESSNTEIRNAKIMGRAAEAILEDKTLNKYAYFTELTKDRAESANMLEKPSMRGIKNSVVEKYSDQAHFIYELLQNADDANATFARFILEPDRLIFAHNGTRHFSVSNPVTEEYDSENGNLGDINAITSIANSNKTSASIGKFGVGFKAVFQYTTSPFIYDPDFCFRIERFIVPVQLDEDFSDRRPGETLFVFPFNHPDRSVKEAYKDIADKLKSLSFPQLFLTNLKDIQFEAGEVLGQYKKRIAHKRTIEATIREKVELTKSIGDETQKESLWLFSRQDEYRRQYSVGFFLDSEGHLKPVNEPAFCFFPTKEYTGLHFILHAPFLLTDSREGIRAGVLYNDRTIQRLANLAADALVYLRDIGKRGPVRLIDDDILKIIPIDTDRFSDPEDRRTVSFLPFYQKILAKLQTDELLPGLNGYSSHQNAYWATSNQLPQLFSDQQLGDLVENKNAQWAFPSLGRDSIDSKRRNYIDSLVYTNVGDEAILIGRKKGTYIYRGVTQSLEQVRGITAEFIAAQSYAWLHRFYKWLSESKRRREMVKTRPIFLNQNSEAVSAFDDHGRNILFLPVKDVDGYNVVNQALLSKKETKEFFGEFGIKHPSLKDQIYNKILPFYESRKQIDSSAHFKMLFDYYCKCANDELDEFVAALNQYKILSFHLDQAPETYRGAGKTMYFPRKDLIEYFSIKKGVRFLAIEEYKKYLKPETKEKFMDFLTDLGVRQEISIDWQKIENYKVTRTDLPKPRSTRDHKWSENIIEGCQELLIYIRENKDPEKSIILWNSLLRIIQTRCKQWTSLEDLLIGKVDYFFRKAQTDTFPSADVKFLRETPWLRNTKGEFVAPCKLPLEKLGKEYETESPWAISLLHFLQIKSGDEDKENALKANYKNLTEAQKKAIDFARLAKQYGLESEADLAEFLEFRRQKEKAKKASETVSQQSAENTIALDEDDDSNEPGEKKPVRKGIKKVMKDIIRRAAEDSLQSESEFGEEGYADEDEYTPSAVDYSQRIEKAKEKSALEIIKIEKLEKLQSEAVRLTQNGKYTYAWFKTLLAMENEINIRNYARNQQISIGFSRVERDPGTKRTLILKHADSPIPQSLEDLSDIPLVLQMGKTSKTVAIEVASVKSFTLRVKLKDGKTIEDIDLSTVTLAKIGIKSPDFLLNELQKQFHKLGLSDKFDMKKNLCENIEFVFGPPGTGKTTHLARNVLIPLMQGNRKCRVLVLTPTNKAADVLVSRIMEVSKANTSYEDWLVRFGATGDEKIENSPVFKEKTFNLLELDKNITVTTMARFPYDYCMTKRARIPLCEIDWDYIVIDEASMIPLANIIYPLYKQKPKKFIIAGDPFQIEPITSVSLWKNENIYTMVELNSFRNPQTQPYNYKVKLLDTQYRSVPAIGEIFSQFTYGGILKHYRKSSSQRPLNVEDDLLIDTLNIIKYPVSKYESIYRAKRLKGSSSYQVYSALFTFEYVCFLARKIAEKNPGELFKIGIVAPYKAQADMIDKLLASEKLPSQIDIQVGTIHGFQGDECDIMFAIFNTPPKISNSKEMFLNKQNIINVSISRARDYLFIIMPDDETEGISSLKLVKRVENLIHSTYAWDEFLSPDLEDLIFDDPHFLEKNAFSTGHQSVNVYGLPERIYEIRTEENAVDVQIHRMADKLEKS